MRAVICFLVSCRRIGSCFVSGEGFFLRPGWRGRLASGDLAAAIPVDADAFAFFFFGGIICGQKQHFVVLNTIARRSVYSQESYGPGTYGTSQGVNMRANLEGKVG